MLFTRRKESAHPRTRITSVTLAGRGVLVLPLAVAVTASLTLATPTAPAAAATLNLASSSFNVQVESSTGGVYQLSNPSDPYRTNYVINPTSRPAFNVNDSRWLGDMVFSVRRGAATTSTSMNTALSDDTRTVTSGANSITVAYSGAAAHANGINGFSLTEAYSLGGASNNQLNWTMKLRNTSAGPIEFRDIGLPLLMDGYWRSNNQTAIYEQNVGRHSFVADDGSYIYWQRPNGIGPYLVMTPQDGTSLEFKDKARTGEGPFGESDPAWEGLVEYYIHSKDVSVARATKSAAYLPATSLTLAAGAEKTYGFTFQWASSYAELQNVLYNAGVVDAISLPGMVVPTDTRATLAVRARAGITGVVGQAGRNITVTSRGTSNGYSIYEISMPTLGTNNVTVNYGAGRQSVVQYYAIQPIETLIASRSNFITTKQQARTTRGYNGAFLQWSMSTHKLITWDDYPGGGWKEWMAGGSDDLGLAPAAFISEKNTTAPIQSQISSVDYYITNFLHRYLQSRTANGQRTYEVYRWYDGQDGTPRDQGVWRVYNYVHIANTYYNMYRIAKSYPTMQTAFTAAQYIDMSFRTLDAMFTRIPPNNPLGDAANTLGLMGESTYPDILAALRSEGRTGDATRLEGLIRAKRDRMFAQAYPFASEMSIDTTGFETTYTLAKMYGNTAMANKAMSASMASRGLQPLWYFYGSDNRHMGESWWNLGYETQLGAWQQQDYMLTYGGTSGAEFSQVMRVTSGAYVAGWANINSGQISSNSADIGAASWQYQSEKGTTEYSHIPHLNGWWAWSGEADLGFWGGLRAASVNVVDDAVVGLYGYGGDVTLANGSYTITPKDGIRTRFAMYNRNKFAVEIQKARYTRAVVADSLTDIRITLQNVTASAYSPRITLRNLPAGTYQVSVPGAATRQITSNGGVVTFDVATLTGSGQVLSVVKI
ncbi:DUF5695 domain-containing protein [Plantactinospora sp. WMMB334]|uniref:DUF5695 domain-containing protein n=1 Tax=Plantactinospora sp. WMMB334 TaxID=3404119 RepID=UPI003B95BD83